MQETGVRNSAYGADKFGLKDLAGVHWNLTEPSLYEHSIAAKEATIVEGGALSAFTGHHTGRSPKDKHTVDDDLTHDVLWWEGNRKMTKDHFATMLGDFRAHVKGKKLFAQDLYGSADPTYRIKVRVFTEYAWHSLFIRQLLIRPEVGELAAFVPELTIIDLPSFKPDPKRHGGREGSDTQVAIDFTNKIVLSLRLLLCRRDEEVGIHDVELLLARPERGADALLGQRFDRRQGERAILRPVGHWQDHVVG